MGLQNISGSGDVFEYLITVDTIEFNIALMVIQQFIQTPLKFQESYQVYREEKLLKVL